MSAIRPPAPSPLFPAQSPASPARRAGDRIGQPDRDFVRAALDGVGAPAEAAPAVARPTVTASVAARASDDRLQRPGSLLDIRV